LKPEANTLAFSNCCLVLPGRAFLRKGAWLPRSFTLSLSRFLSSSFVIRHSSFVILLALVCSLQLASSAKAQTPLTSPGLDGIDCVTAYDISDDAPLQTCDNSPDPWNDFDEISLPTNDKAVLPSRFQQNTAFYVTTSYDAVTLRRLGTVPNLLLSAHSFYSLREHLRERAPPSLV
jgi:hypothetical protein